ncbi:MAG: hypothetical protein RL226_1345 [Bacteroidota bacterium]|jgi:hypothetical protein
MEKTDDLKLRLIEFIINEKSNEALMQVEDLVKRISYDEDSRQKVIGSRPNGVKVIKSEFEDCLLRTLIDVNNGEYISLEELDKRSQTW